MLCTIKLIQNQCKNKKNKFVAIAIAIMLTSVLFQVSFHFAFALLDNLNYIKAVQSGSDNMVDIQLLTDEQYQTLSKDERVKNASHRIFIGTPANEELNGYNVEILYAEDKNAKSLFQYPTEGRMPQAEDEIAISRQMLKCLDEGAHIGDTVDLEFMVNGRKLEKTCKISGTWETNEFAPCHYIYLSKAFQEKAAPTRKDLFTGSIDEISGYIMMDFDFTYGIRLEQQYVELMQDYGYDGNRFMHSIKNDAVTVDFGNAAFFFIFILLIFLAAYIIIENIFLIYLKLDIHFYGLLKTIGTTHRQLRRIVYGQGIMIALISIPLGLCIGYVITRFGGAHFFSLFSEELQDMQKNQNILSYIVSAAISMLAVLSGCYKPYKFIKEHSSISAIKYEEQHANVALGEKHIVWKLSIKNVMREKKQLVSIVLSLSLAVLIGNYVNCFLNSLSAEKYIENFIQSDFSIGSRDVLNGKSIYDKDAFISQNVFDDMDRVEAIDSYFKIYCAENQSIQLSKEKAREIEKSAGDLFTDEEEKEYFEKTNRITATVYGIHDTAGRIINLDTKTDWEKFNSGKGCVISCNFDKDGAFSPYKIGDTIDIVLEDGSTVSYEILALEKLPYSMDANYYIQLGADVILSEEAYVKKFSAKNLIRLMLNAKEGRQDEAEDYIKKKTAQYDDIDYVTKQYYLNQFQHMTLEYRVIGYGFVAVLFIIGILNYINTIIINITARKKEIALLEAIGMTKKQLKKMISYESMTYIFLIMAFSILFFSVLGGPVIKLYCDGMWYFDYNYDISVILLSYPILLMIGFIISRVTFFEISKVELTKRIRD